jgi:radical SAM superfamily enzyme YgiQ (UPF0313 family)
MIDLLIITAPFTYTFGPSLSPALLKSCTEKENIKTRTWDLSAEFNLYQNLVEYKSVIAWMNSPELTLTPSEYQWYQSLIISYAEKICNTYKPSNLAISLLTLNSQRFTEDLCYHVKLLNSDIKIILGGSGLDIFQYQYQKPWHNLMIDSGLADLIILGEGEVALPTAILNDSYGVISAPQLTNQELDQIPIPNYDDYDFRLYQKYKDSYWSRNNNAKQETDLVFLITASKGCVKNCNFCDVGKIWNKFRFRSASNVADEIMFLHQKYNAKYFSFTDSLINGGMKVFYELNNILEKKLPNTISYEGQMICRSRPEMPERHFLAMSNAGCKRVSIGLESGSEQVRMFMGKGSSQEAVHYTTSMLIKYNISQQWNIIAGYPTETDTDWNETMKLIKYWLPRSNGLLTITPTSTFLLIDGTPMTETDDYKYLGIEKSTINGYSGFAWTTTSNPGNTFETRANRFFELCNYLLEFDPALYSNVENKMQTLKRQLDWYHNESKSKKIFNISFSKSAS